jgi:hypothetical protein
MVPALGNPRLRLFVGATMISFSPVWVKLVSVSPTTSGFYRVFFGGIALAIFLSVSRQGLRLDRRVWWILAASAVFFSGTAASTSSVPACPRCWQISRCFS